ncbi:hypothetical protein [Paracoccus spongiarum]|uniref:Capsular biosynthesis protein n=1 Tax=Paracoccus spongiarum TaxID=3064387 RepID=A0ABT9JAV8_9RHOB|nr:hypothetical protein [Paracoccus sp. 2205BS29-5]MDP5306969.1 hypothetical protein [Paracoccus sp. 2205BS29-5]
MSQPRILRIYLHPPTLALARAGKLGFIARLRTILEDRGWQVGIERSGPAARAAAPDRPGYALFHMEKPTHDRALTFRLAYHYPFWRLEPMAERWRWPVALAPFAPDGVDAAEARDFAARLAARVLPGPPPRRGDHVLVPLQGRIRQQRSFQCAAPLAMLAAVARGGRPCIATLHPRETYDPADLAALGDLAARHPNLRIGGDTQALLRDCAFVVTQNSAVAFDGYLLDKPAVLFAQADFHHIALNAAQLGPTEALVRAATHRPPFEAYLFWFLRRTSLDMMAPDADARLVAAMRKGGWPV